MSGTFVIKRVGGGFFCVTRAAFEWTGFEFATRFASERAAQLCIASGRLRGERADTLMVLPHDAAVLDCATASGDDFACIDCNASTDDFWVEDALWHGAVPENAERIGEGKHTYMCIACFERRIGRQLRADDFPKCPANAMVHLLFARLGGAS